jgi:hypothetical protein
MNPTEPDVLMKALVFASFVSTSMMVARELDRYYAAWWRMRFGELSEGGEAPQWECSWQVLATAAAVGSCVYMAIFRWGL